MIRIATASDDQRNCELNDACVDTHAFVIHYLDEIRARIHTCRRRKATDSIGRTWAT